MYASASLRLIRTKRPTLSNGRRRWQVPARTVLGRRRSNAAISGTVSKSLPLDKLSPIASSHSLEPRLDGRCRNDPLAHLFATFEFSGPDKSVQVVESNPEDSRCLDCCHFCFFHTHRCFSLTVTMLVLMLAQCNVTRTIPLQHPF